MIAALAPEARSDLIDFDPVAPPRAIRPPPTTPAPLPADEAALLTLVEPAGTQAVPLVAAPGDLLRTVLDRIIRPQARGPSREATACAGGGGARPPLELWTRSGVGST